MRFPKWLKYVLQGLAVFGGIVIAAIIVRSVKASKQSGGSVQTKDAVLASLQEVTRMNPVIVFLLSIPIGLYVLGSMNDSAAFQHAILLGSIAASVQQSFNITYVPQFIRFTTTSAPTFMQINIQGDGLIFNLDATGQTALKNIRQVANIGNTYIYQLANGLINGKNGSITIANAAAAQLDVYGYSYDPGDFYLTYNSQNAIASSGIALDKFAYAAFPSAAANDIFNVTWQSGITQSLNRLELESALSYTQNNASGVYNIDNISPARVKSLIFNPVSAQTVYVVQYQSAKGAVNSALVQSQVG